MKISVPEIKILIKQYITKPNETYTTSDVYDYVSKHSKKEVDRRHIGIAIRQSIDEGKLIRVSKGLYTMPSVETKVPSKEEIEFKEKIYNSMTKMEEIIKSSISPVDLFESSDESLDLMKDMYKLIESINDIKMMCTEK